MSLTANVKGQYFVILDWTESADILQVAKTLLPL